MPTIDYLNCPLHYSKCPTRESDHVLFFHPLVEIGNYATYDKGGIRMSHVVDPRI